MNERIQKLAEQARKYAWENETHWSADAERATLFEQKFAELIVKECADMADNEGRFLRHDNLAKKIRKHFGVE